MIKKLQFSLLTIALLILAGCDHEDPPIVQPGQVTFSFKRSGNNIPVGKVKDQPTPAFVSYTIKKPDGAIVSSEIELYPFTGGFVTHPQQLTTGHYELQQFLILDADRHVTYATPSAGSDLAVFAAYPLPISFDITATGTTTVVPEVLAVQGYTPEDFGYVTFGFDVVEVAAIEIPLAAIEEEITKISYEFTNTTGTIAAEVVPSGAVHTLNIPELLDQTWQATITVWARKDCYQKIYRYKNQVTFNGAVLKLASVEHESWTPFYYYETYNHIKILHSMIDPRGEYHVEIQYPSDVGMFGGFLDRGYWDLEGDALCNTVYIDDFEDAGARTVKASILAAPVCDPVIDELHTYQVDIWIMLMKTWDDPNDLINAYFLWDVTDGVMKPHCD